MRDLERRVQDGLQHIASKVRLRPEHRSATLDRARKRKVTLYIGATLVLVLSVGTAAALVTGRAMEPPPPPAPADAPTEQSFGRYMFSFGGGFNRGGRPAEQTGIVEINLDAGTACLMSQVLGATAAHLHPEGPGESITLFEPPRRYEPDLCTRDLPTEPLQALTADPQSYSIEFHNATSGGTLSAQLEPHGSMLPCPAQPPARLAKGEGGLPLPEARSGGSLDVVFPDGTTAELAYPAGLDMSELRAFPRPTGGPEGDPIRPLSFYGGVPFALERLEGPVRCIETEQGEHVPVWDSAQGELIVLEFGAWHVILLERQADLELWANNLSGEVTDDGWLILRGQGPLRIGPEIGPGDAPLMLADRTRIINLWVLDCEGRHRSDSADEVGETSIAYCLEDVDIEVHVDGPKRFVQEVFEGLNVRNVERAFPLDMYELVP